MFSDRWIEDSKLCALKFFRFMDEPTAKALTDEEVQAIRLRMLGDDPSMQTFHNSEEYKHKESLMEMKHKKDSEKDIEDKLGKMQEKIKWSRPASTTQLFLGLWNLTIYLNLGIFQGEDNMFSKNVGKESVEAEKQQKRISSKLQCLYLKDYQIPEQPSREGLEEAPPATEEVEPLVIPLHNVSSCYL